MLDVNYDFTWNPNDEAKGGTTVQLRNVGTKVQAGIPEVSAGEASFSIIFFHQYHVQIGNENTHNYSQRPSML